MLGAIAAIVLNLAIGPNGVLVPDHGPASGISDATHPAAIPPPPDAPAPPPGTGKHCVAPADLARDASVQYHPAPGDVPADLPGPRFNLPPKIELDLGQTVGAPAPNYSQMYFGNAEIDTETGAVTINGVDFSERLVECR